MNNNLEKSITSEINIEHLKADCENCFGLCCVALYFSKSDGFPVEKAGGQPCFIIAIIFARRFNNFAQTIYIDKDNSLWHTIKNY